MPKKSESKSKDEAKNKKLPFPKEELDYFMASRIFAYSLLKRVFLEEPSKEFLEILISDKLAENLPYIEGKEKVKEGVTEVTNYLKDPDVLKKENCDDLMADYTHLFIGPDKLPSPPWESVYRSPKRLTFQREAMLVRREYQKYDLRSEKFPREPDDHIGLELDFMRYLSEKTVKNLKRDKVSQAKRFIDAQKEFLSTHLLKWAPAFSKDVARNARTDFYRGFGKVLEGFLKIDHSMIDKLAKELEESGKKEKKKKKSTKSTENKKSTKAKGTKKTGKRKKKKNI